MLVGNYVIWSCKWQIESPIDCCWVINPTQNYIILPVISINFVMIDDLRQAKSFGNFCWQLCQCSYKWWMEIIIGLSIDYTSKYAKKQSFQLIMTQPHVTRPRISDPAEIFVLAHHKLNTDEYQHNTFSLLWHINKRHYIAHPSVS